MHRTSLLSAGSMQKAEACPAAAGLLHAAACLPALLHHLLAADLPSPPAAVTATSHHARQTRTSGNQIRQHDRCLGTKRAYASGIWHLMHMSVLMSQKISHSVVSLTAGKAFPCITCSTVSMKPVFVTNGVLNFHA